MQLIIDQIKNEYAIVELPDGSFEDIPAAVLPEGSKTGSILEISLKEEQTTERTENIRKKMDRIFCE